MESDPLIRQAERATRSVLLVTPEPGSPGTVALLPGSFDPITVAHAALADEVAARADLVVLVYAVRTLPKEGVGPPPLLSPEERLRILRRFSDARPGLTVGVASHGLLAEQVEAASDRFPRARVWLVMGSDKALQLLDPKWYRDRDASLSALFERAGVLYAERAGQEGAVEAALQRAENGAWRDLFELVDLDPAVAAISSRAVRERLLAGADVRRLVPEAAREAVAARAGPSGPG
jgi:nicotinic acid mononucleotide adenylyltransferase